MRVAGRLERAQSSRHGPGTVGAVHEVGARAMDGADRSQPFLMTDVWAHRPAGWQLVARHVSPLASSGP